MAARTGQALLFPETSNGVAHGRLQLYVDDPALVVVGNLEEQKMAIDLLVTWFLVLGIPSSWRKGFFTPAEIAHTWIGVTFKVTEPGVATLSLTAKFLDSLLQRAKWFASSASTATMKQAQ